MQFANDHPYEAFINKRAKCKNEKNILPN